MVRAPWYSRINVNVGLATCPPAPAPAAIPRARTVLPAPRSPESATTSPARSSPPRRRPRASDSSGLEVCRRSVDLRRATDSGSGVGSSRFGKRVTPDKDRDGATDRASARERAHAKPQALHTDDGDAVSL